MKKTLFALLVIVTTSSVLADSKPITFEGLKFKVDGEEVKWVGNAKNSSSARVKGQLCIKFVDNDGFIIKEKPAELQIGSGSEKAFDGFTYVSDIGEVDKVTVRLSRHGCLTDIEIHSDTYEFKLN